MKKVIIYCALLASVVGCQESDVEKKRSDIAQNEMSVERAFLHQQGELVKRTIDGEEIEFEKVGDKFVFQGDIVLTEDQLNSASFGRTKSGTALDNKLWPNGIVPYQVDADLVGDSRIAGAIAEWEFYTEIDLVPRTNQTDYIRFVSGDGCSSSSIGRAGGQQTISLHPNCSEGNAIHEIGHAVGLFHEHCRNDRDTYVTVLSQNIESGKAHNFDKFGSSGDDVRSFDFGSIMLYSSTAFANPNTYTIVDKNGNPFIGQRWGLSNGDIDGIAILYRYYEAAILGSAQWIDGPHVYSDYSFLMADFTGDSKADMLVVKPSDERAVVWKSTGTSYQSGAEWLNGPYIYNGYSMIAGDVSGDGKADLIGVNGSEERIIVWKANSTGTGFLSGAEWMNGPYIYSGYSYHAADVNGDGKMDIVGVNSADERVLVWKSNSTGTGFLSGAEWINGPNSYNNYSFQVGDVSGDGKADLIAVSGVDERMVVWRANSSGTAFISGAEWINGPYNYSMFNFSVGDMNSDGKADIVGTYPNDERILVWYANATGTGFQSGSELIDGSFNYSGYTLKAADTDGDGKGDVIGFNLAQERSVVWLGRPE